MVGLHYQPATWVVLFIIHTGRWCWCAGAGAGAGVLVLVLVVRATTNVWSNILYCKLIHSNARVFFREDYAKSTHPLLV
jgi:hypothetical protein